MSTVDRPERKVLPPLVAGQRLDQETFHERYEAMPPGTRAELVGGVVYMPSPLRYEHGELDDTVGGWLFRYRCSTRPLSGSANVTTRLGRSGEVQPDRQMRIPEALGGQSRVVDGKVVGAAELIVEVSKSSLAYDLGPKKLDFERAGVLEYVVIAIDPDHVYWFVKRAGRFVDLPPGPDGIFRSDVFPGLWLNPSALFADDLPGLVETLDHGLATPEHQAFAARLAEAARPV